MTTEFGRLRSQRNQKQLPRDEMEKRIVRVLKTNNICVLATASGAIPRATPIEYYSKDMTLYISVGPGLKMENLKASPHVSIAIYTTPYTDWTDWYRVQGLQITGKAQLLTARDPGYSEAMDVYDWRLYYKAMGKNITEPPRERTVLRVVAEKVEMRDLSLMREGYGVKQIWEAAGD